MEQVLPFYIPLGPANVGAVALVRIEGRNCNRVELQVVAGGPVYGFSGRLDASEAYTKTHPAAGSIPDFDMAANASESGDFKIDNRGQITLHAEVATIGYLRLIEH